MLLLGGSDDDNLFQWPEDKLIPHLDRLKAAGGNVVRNTMSDRKDRERGGFEVYPFQRREDGLYDLEEWNEEYWDRFARLLRETAKRDILVQIEIWDRFDYSRDEWRDHPYNPRNNVNYTFETSGFAEAYPDHPGANKQPFFFTTPRQRNNETVFRFQKRFVDRMLDHALRFPNVLYCVSNETRGEEAWSRYWAEHVRDRARQSGRRVFLTEMRDDWDLTAPRHKQTFDHPDLYEYVDVSQNTHLGGQRHWDNFLHARAYLAERPRPMNTTKVYGASTYKGHTDQEAIERFWRHLLAGAASIRFHRPPAGLGLNDKATACIRAARKLESKAPLWTLQPANSLLHEREPNQSYLAADAEGRAAALYLPDGGEARIALPDGVYRVHWIDIDTGEWGTEDVVRTRDGRLRLETPQGGNRVAVLLRDTKPTSTQTDPIP